MKQTKMFFGGSDVIVLYNGSTQWLRRSSQRPQLLRKKQTAILLKHMLVFHTEIGNVSLSFFLPLTRSYAHLTICKKYDSNWIHKTKKKGSLKLLVLSLMLFTISNFNDIMMVCYHQLISVISDRRMHGSPVQGYLTGYSLIYIVNMAYSWVYLARFLNGELNNIIIDFAKSQHDQCFVCVNCVSY